MGGGGGGGGTACGSERTPGGWLERAMQEELHASATSDPDVRWCPLLDLNQRPPACRADALSVLRQAGVVVPDGVEPPTSPFSEERSAN